MALGNLRWSMLGAALIASAGACGGDPFVGGCPPGSSAPGCAQVGGSSGSGAAGSGSPAGGSNLGGVAGAVTGGTGGRGGDGGLGGASGSGNSGAAGMAGASGAQAGGAAGSGGGSGAAGDPGGVGVGTGGTAGTGGGVDGGSGGAGGVAGSGGAGGADAAGAAGSAGAPGTTCGWVPGTIQVISSLATQLPGQTHFALQRFERADDVQSVAVADWGTPPTTQVFRIPYAGGEFIPTTLGTGERVLDARNIGGTVTALAVGPDDDSTVEAIAIVNVSNALKRVALTSPLPPGLHVIAGSLLPDGQNGYYLALAAHDDAGAPDQLFVARWAGSPVSPVLVGNAPFAAVDSMVRTGDTTYLFNHSLGQIALTDAQPTNIDFRGWPPGVTVWPGADSETLFDVVSRTTDAAPIFAFAALPTTQAGTFDVAALPSNGDVATALLTNDDSLRWRDGLVVSAGPATGSPGRLSLIWLDAAHGMLGAELLPPTGNGGKPTAARAHVHSVSSAQPPTFDVAWTEEFTNLATPYDKLFYGQVRCE